MAVRYKRPVYLELPRDRVKSKSLYPHWPASIELQSDPESLQASLSEAAEKINAARQPVLIAGVEIHRFGLQKEVLKLAESLNIPISATLLGKSVIAESHPLYLGVYEGAMGRESVRKYVETSDCVILLGAFMTDINLGIFTAHLDPSKCIYATSEQLRVGHHYFRDVLLKDFVTGLHDHQLTVRSQPEIPVRESRFGQAAPEASPVTIASLFQHIETVLADKMVVIADVGDSLFASSDLTIRKQTEFISRPTTPPWASRFPPPSESRRPTSPSAPSSSSEMAPSR